MQELLGAAGGGFETPRGCLRKRKRAHYTCKKAIELGARVVAMCDSDGYVTDENGIDFETIARSRRVRRARVREYAGRVPDGKLCPRREHLDRPVRHRAALRDPERAGHRGGRDASSGTESSLWARARTCRPRRGPSGCFRQSGRARLPRPRRPTPAASLVSGLEMRPEQPAPFLDACGG
jgi:hypothetical protein